MAFAAKVYYSEAFPGHEYDTIPFEKLENPEANVGDKVSVKYGVAKCQGVLIEKIALPEYQSTSDFNGLVSLARAAETIRLSEQLENCIIAEKNSDSQPKDASKKVSKKINKKLRQKKGNKSDRVGLYEMVSLGPNTTKINKEVYDSINWGSYTSATRKLLMVLFPRDVLASSNLTGRPSPAFQNINGMEKKFLLDPRITSDIIHVVSRNCGVEKSRVRAAITSKCADETKLRRLRMKES